MHMTTLLLSLPLILSETNSNLQILWDFVFQLNLDFISNSNPKTSRLLPHPYISLGAPPPCIPMPISPQKRTLATTRVSPPSLLPVVTATSIPKPFLQIKPHVDREKSEPNHRKKNHVETRSVASAIYRRSLTIISHQAASFSVNLKSIRRYR
jgi:hypothetical protein